MAGGKRHLLTRDRNVFEGVPTFPAGMTLGGFNSGNFLRVSELKSCFNYVA